MRNGALKWSLKAIFIVWLLAVYAASGTKQHKYGMQQGPAATHTGIRSIRGLYNTNEQWIDEEWMMFLQKQQFRIGKLREKQATANSKKGKIRG